jgi:hypothetical protein
MNRPRFALLFAALAAAAASAGTAGAADAQADAKTYTLFRGASLSVGLNGQVYPVMDISGGAWVIRRNGELVVVSAKDGPINLKVAPALRLTEKAASVSNLMTEPAYTPENDPYTKFTKQMSEAANSYAGDQSAAKAANATMDAATTFAQRVGASSPSSGPPSASGVGDSPASASAQSGITNAANMVNGANMTAGASPGIAVGAKTAFDPNGENYDAMNVAFEVSSEKPLNRPFIVITAEFRARNDPPGAYRKWVYAQALERIDSKGAKVQFLKGGFPPGFEMRDVQLHVYNEGDEVATNISKERVPYTRQEAFEFVKSHYISSHKGATLPPVPALAKLPPDLPSLLSQGKYGQPIYIKVNKDGLAQDVFIDPNCLRPAGDPYLESLAKGILFEPALEDGKPVDSVAALNLSQLAM